MYRIEGIILCGLIKHQEFSRKVIPFIKSEYFSSQEETLLFETIKNYIITYGQLPSESALNVEVDNIVNINEKSYKELKALVKNVAAEDLDDKDLAWLVDNTEKFCQDKALFNAITESIQIMEASKSSKSYKNLTKTAIPSILSQALSVTFDSKVGHDYFGDADERFAHYNTKENKIPFDLELLNKITDEGLPNKSLTIVLGATGTGKSLVLCHFAANNLLDNKNVLYISLEMSEKEVGKRIDANLFDIDINNLKNVTKPVYDTHINSIRKKSLGRLIVKEYPPASAHAGHFRFLLDELKMKEKFVPDIIYLDYVNLCLSMRVKMEANSYSYIKSIAEEVRGLAVEFDLPIVSATQTNRCLTLDTIVQTEFGQKEIGLVNVGDRLKSHNGFVEVKKVYPIEKQKVYKITTKSCKIIKCSSKHLFPTTSGIKSIDSCLKIGDYFYVWDEGINEIILDEISFIEIIDEEEETIDISVSNDNLFFANNILTHNSGYDNSEVDLSNVSESTGLSATADLMFAIISTEQLRLLNQLMIKQLKNRYNDVTNPSKFVVGIDRAKMRLYDLEAIAQNSINVPGQQNTGVGPNNKGMMFGGTSNKFSSINV